MARISDKRLNDLQKEYDSIIVQEKKLDDAIEQATASFEYFKNKFGDSSKEALAAQKRLDKEKERQEIFESKKTTRMNQINTASEGKVKLRSYDEIVNEDAKNQNGVSALKANLRAKGGGLSGKAGLAAGIANVVGGLFDVGTDIYIAEQKKSLNTWMANQDTFLKTIETGSKIFQRNMKTFSKGMEGALSSSFASITQGVQEGAYAAANSSIDWATEAFENQFQTEIDRLKLENYKVTRQKQAENENLKLTNQEINGAVGAVSNIASLVGPIGQVVGGIAQSIAKNATKMLEANSEIELLRLQKENEVAEAQLQAMNEAKTAAVDASKEAVSKVLEFSNSIETLSKKTDAAAKSMASLIGLPGASVDAYEKFIYSAGRSMKFTDSFGKTTYLNKDAEDMMKVQSQYIEERDRSKTMSQKDLVKTFQLGKVVGDDNLAASLLGGMDYFNKSIATGSDLIYEMFQEANKAGVSNRKFAKDLQQNLKLASKYTFKGGVKGMMQMAIWAQKTRFNMQNLEGIVDNIQDGGLEGVITKAAKLQVLGGNFAMGSDPIGMMYEAWSDPEALAKRFSDMTKGLGHFNSKTGEVDINGADAMMLKQYAEASGIDYKDARAQITQRIKGEQVDKQLTKDYTDTQKAMIYNKASLNDKGEWVVNVTDANGKVKEKSINDLSGTDWNSLMPTEESIEDYVAKIYNLLEQEGGATKYGQAVVTDETSDNLKENIQQRIKDNLQFVNDNIGKLKEMVEKSNDFVTDQNKSQHDVMIATSKILDDQFDLIKESTEKLKLGIENSGSELRTALDAVKKQLDAELAEIKYGENSEQAKKANEAAGKANDKLAKGLGMGEGSRPVAKNSAQEAMVTMASNLSQSELKERVDLYKKITKQYGELSLKNKDKFEDVLDLGVGDKEILNELKKHGAIDVSDTEDLKFGDLSKVVEAMKYLNDNFNMLVKQTKDYKEQGGSTSTAPQAKPQSTARYDIPSPKYTSGRGSIMDGVMSANGNPIVSQATCITPIHDGMSKLAQSDPTDTAIFAKTGGPFDKLFNGVFDKINSVYNAITANNDKVEADGSERMLMRAAGKAMGISAEVTKATEPMSDSAIRQQWQNALHTPESTTSPSKPMELNISGSIDLKAGGESFDIMGTLRNNPLFIRELSQLITRHLSEAENGGRGKHSMSYGSV